MFATGQAFALDEFGVMLDVCWHDGAARQTREDKL
jgi:hypothetical protein